MLGQDIADGVEVLGEGQPEGEFLIGIVVNLREETINVIVEEHCILLHLISVHLEYLELLPSFLLRLHLQL